MNTVTGVSAIPASPVKQAFRQQFYSFVKYPEAGGSQFNFFGDAVNTAVNRQLTNLPQANRFGNVDFQLKSIGIGIFINNELISSATTTITSSLYGDLIGGFAQSGVFELRVAGKTLIQVNKPFLTFGSGSSMPQVKRLVTGNVEILGRATLLSREKTAYSVDPNIIIKDNQNFEAVISYPSGLVPVIGTGVTDNTTNPLYVGLIFDGLVYLPIN